LTGALIEETTMDDRHFIAGHGIVVGDTIRFTEDRYPEPLVVVAKVLEIGLISVGEAAWPRARMVVVESSGTRALVAGDEVRRVFADMRHDGYARLLWDDESKRPDETNDN
jgi:hypothetical protein